jgi:hypothetical protein
VKSIKLAVPALILVAGFVLCSYSVYATPEYSKKEKKACTYCHTKVSADKSEMAKDLNDTGTCYKDNAHSLDKCASPAK